jgi:hypothetical protein
MVIPRVPWIYAVWVRDLHSFSILNATKADARGKGSLSHAPEIFCQNDLILFLSGCQRYKIHGLWQAIGV